jgi:Putative serine esterase (DUF676)
MRKTCFLWASPLALALVGCGAPPVNPAFAVSFAQAHAAIGEMRAEPKPLARPLVVIGGFADLNVSPPLYRHFFRGVARDAQIIPVSVGFCQTFDECREKVLAAVERSAPSGAEAQWTTEVDVMGASLGGLVARYAAAPAQSPDGNRKRLRIARLFTISSPHDGADLAEMIALTQFHRDLRPNSAFLRRLAESDPHPNYELFPYVHLGDEIVGEQHAAPAGTNPIWLSNPPLAPPHLSAMMDERILADISRRLRGEEPLSHPPSPPLPGSVPSLPGTGGQG